MNRRRRTVVASAVALLATLGLSACDGGIQIGDGAAGPRATLEQDISAVTAVDIRASGTMRVVAGDEPSLTITAGERVLERITAVVQGETLTIDLPGAWLNAGAIQYELVTPALSAVTISGSADVSGELAPAGDEVAVRITGSGTVDLTGADGAEITVDIGGSGDVELADVAARTVQVTIDGSGGVGITGTTDALDVAIPGSGSFRGEDLAAQDATVSIRGSGSAVVAAARTLDVRIAGSGDVSYLGDPEVTEDVSGSGDVGPA